MKRNNETVYYKPIIGTFKKMSRDRACRLILADYDSSPMTGTEFIKRLLNYRLKGATVEEFLAEREAAKSYAMHS